MAERTLSCADCGVVNCNVMNKEYPDFCVTTHMDQEVKREALALYEEEDNRKVMQTAAGVECDRHCDLRRPDTGNADAGGDSAQARF